jgi:hypothetical protein
VDGYFSEMVCGEGRTARSISKPLLDDLRHLLTFGIRCQTGDLTAVA